MRSLELRSGELLSRAPVLSHCGSPGSTAVAVRPGQLPGSLEFIERLRMRLGELAVHGLICQDSHCPEGASRPLSPAGS